MPAEREPIHVGLNLSPTEDMRAAALPLLEAGEVDALEWSVDMGFSGVPAWVDALLAFYGGEGRLVAHGVEMSLLTVGQDARRRRWLDRFSEAWARWSFTHASEHFGFMTAGPFIGGTPFPHPRSEAAVALGRRRLDELAQIVGDAPLGLENLAFALSPRDVDEQPDFLEALLSPRDGFLLLDLHNLLCQAENFGRDPLALLERYPLHRVRQAHLAGGTHFEAPAGRFRRDDHERDVPEVCLELLDEVVRRCPKLRYVFVEHADHGLRSAQEVEAFQRTYRRIRDAVRAAPVIGAAGADSPPEVASDRTRRLGSTPSDERGTPEPALGVDALDVEALAEAQSAFLEVLDDSADATDARAKLGANPALDPWREWIDTIDARALELAVVLVRRWGEREQAPAPGAMRAAVLEAPGVLRFRDTGVPEPGPGEVRLRVEASGLCGTDIHLWRDLMPAELPLVLGHEPVGVVEAVGVHIDGVDMPPLGARVGVPWAQAGCGTCERCARGQWRFCPRLVTWMKHGGAFADWMIADARGCVPIPDGLHPAAAAPLFCAGHTVYGGLHDVQPGERVAILGLGGLGHLAIQLAAHLGAHVTALTTNPTKAGDALALGAHEVVVGDDPLPALIRSGGVDAVLSTSSDATAASRLVRALRPEGRLLIAGLDRAPLVIPTEALVQRGASVRAVIPGPRDQLGALLALAASGAIRPRVESYPLAQLRRAMHRLEDRRVRYRAVIRLAE